MLRSFIVTALFTIIVFYGCHDDTLSPFSNSNKLGKNDSTQVSLKYGESTIINKDLVICFSAIPADSRCPIDVMCVWAGDGEVELTLKKGDAIKKVSLHTTLEPKEIIYDNYEIKLLRLSPLRKAAEQLKPEQYSVQLQVKNINSLLGKSIYLIDGNSECLVAQDKLIVNNVLIENNSLILYSSYNGGCNEHIINLYAYTGIMKSNPPQMSLVISHESNNDMCEAILSNKSVFDLKKIKNYLDGIGAYEKVILNITDPSGPPVKQSPLVYNLK